MPAAITDLLGGQIDFLFADVVTGLPHVHSGRLRALAVTTPKRLANAPAVPTMAEAGVPGYELVNWFGVFLPAKAPEPLVGIADAGERSSFTKRSCKVLFARSTRPLACGEFAHRPSIPNS